MRYHWGLGVGHFHAHQPAAALGCVPKVPEDSQPIDSGQEEVLHENDIIAHLQDGDSDVYDSDNSELGLDDRQSEGWGEVESDESGGDEDVDETMEDEWYTGM
jgi:hypothetical protein